MGADHGFSVLNMAGGPINRTKSTILPIVIAAAKLCFMICFPMLKTDVTVNSIGSIY